jgi:peroxiredoxin
MDFVLAIAEDQVPSTHAPDPYMHLFMDAGNGNVLAFFELPNSPGHGARRQHARTGCSTSPSRSSSVQELEETKARLEAAGIAVVGVTDHTIFKSIYFFDPNGHRLELAADTATPEMYQKLDEVKWEMLEEWSAPSARPSTPPGCTRRNSLSDLRAQRGDPPHAVKTYTYPQFDYRQSAEQKRGPPVPATRWWSSAPGRSA